VPFWLHGQPSLEIERVCMWMMESKNRRTSH
jgi:hypothetical protein